MKHLVLLFILVSIGNISFTQNNNKNDIPYLLRITDNSSNGQNGYIDPNGDTIISPNKYPVCFTDTFRIIAFVVHDDEIVAIDRSENILFSVYHYDNGPDYVSDGLFRIIRGNKIGYANMNGEIVIEPSFTCAFPFKNGLAAFCKGGRLVKDGEYEYREDSKWGAINKFGEVVIEAVYDRYFEFEDGIATVERDGQQMKINRLGESIEP